MRLSLLCALLLLVAPPAPAACIDCACGPITVTADTEALAEAACDAAAAAVGRLAAAGLTEIPPLEIFTVDTIPEAHRSLAATLDAGRARITVLSPAGLAEHVKSSSAFSRISPETQFAGLVAHELTHALLIARYGPREDRIAHEYIAYAVQVDLYPEAERARFLEGRDMSATARPGALSDVLLMLAPDAFAARAWALFRAEGAGQAAVARAMSGELSFPSLFHGVR